MNLLFSLINSCENKEIFRWVVPTPELKARLLPCANVNVCTKRRSSSMLIMRFKTVLFMCTTSARITPFQPIPKVVNTTDWEILNYFFPLFRFLFASSLYLSILACHSASQMYSMSTFPSGYNVNTALFQSL